MVSTASGQPRPIKPGPCLPVGSERSGVMKTALWVKICVVAMLGLCRVSLADEPPREVPTVDPFFMLSGALLTDSFDKPDLDASLWSRPGWLVENHKSAIGAGVEKGRLVILGRAQPL